MSQSSLGRSLRSLLITALVVGGVGIPGSASADDPTGCPTMGASLGAASGLIASESWAECGNPAAHDPASTLAVGLPGGSAAALLTTGTAANAAPDATPPTGGTAWSDATSHGMARDVSTYQIDVAVPEGHNCLAFDYVIGSDEFGTEWDAHDGFVASIGSNDWALTPGPGGGPILGASHAFASYETHTAASVIGQLNGTSYAGVTAPMHAEVGVPPGQTTIYLSVYDGGYYNHGLDNTVDTGVFLDGLTTFADPEGCASPVNGLPTAEDDGSTQNPLAVTTDVPTPIAVGVNDFDPDGDLLTLSIEETPVHGSVNCANSAELQGPVCWFTSASGYMGPDAFTYRVTDGKGGFAEARVYVDASADDPRTVQILGTTGQPDVTVSAQVRWPIGVGSAGVSTRLLVGPNDAGLNVVGDPVSTDEFGYVTFPAYSTPESGTYLFRVALASDPDIHADQSRFVDHNPPTAVVIAGPKVVQVGVEATWTITMKRASGDAVQSFTGSCYFEGQDGPPLPIPCTTEDGQAEVSGAFDMAGDVNLMFEGEGLSDMCFVHVQDELVTGGGDCSDLPPSPLQTLTLERTTNAPVSVGDAVRFVVTATRANGTPYAGSLLCGVAPGTAVDCGGTSHGLFATDGTGRATLCWVPTQEGPTTFGVADNLPLDDPGTHSDSVDLQVGPSDGHDVPCSGAGEPVSSLALSGPTQGNIGVAVTVTVTANLGAEGPLICTLTRGGVAQAVTTCDGIANGFGTLQFTPAAAGDYLVSVASASVSSAPFAFHAVDPNPPPVTVPPTVTPPVTPVVTVKAKKLKNRKDQVAGTVTAAAPGAVVILERKLAKGGWKTVAQTTLNGSTYSFRVRTVKGKRQFRVTVPAVPGWLAVTSSIVRLR